MDRQIDDPGARFCAVCSALNIPQKQLADALSISEVSVSRWKTLGIPAKHALSLEKLYGVNAEYLVKGAGEMFASEDRKADDARDQRRAGAVELLAAFVRSLTQDQLIDARRLIDERLKKI